MKVCTHCRARFTGNPTNCPLDGAPLVDLPDPLIGKSIGGRYRVEAKVGAGGMATVYRASHDLLGRKVAIKFLSPELANDATQKERFLREAKAANRIKHENIIDISDYGEEEGYVYLVMEYLEGETLAHVIARGPVPPREAIEYMIQTSRALARAHELEVIHRDLKPENIYLVKRDGRPHVKLLDFGLAHVSTEVRLTALGTIFGTPEYMSPEQARGQPVGPGSDLYSLGVVFFEMLTARIPFEGSTAELIVKHLRTPAPSVLSYMPDLPAEIDAVVAKLLNKDPAKRHRDAHHLIDDLTSLLMLLPTESRLIDTIDDDEEDDRTLVDSRDKVLRVLPELARTAPSIANPERDPTTTVPVSVRSWVERRALYRRAMDTAYARRAAPQWATKAVERMDSLVDRAATLESEIESVARQMATHERSAGELRERIGRALDELARDESGVLRLLEDLERRGERARQRLEQCAADYRKAFADAKATEASGALETADGAVVIETLGRRAASWRQALQESEEVRSQIDSRAAAREDLRFQVAQLKGRLGMVNADVEHELISLRDRASELGAQMSTLQEQLAETASSLSQHLMADPEARPLLARSLDGGEKAS